MMVPVGMWRTFKSSRNAAAPLEPWLNTLAAIRFSTGFSRLEKRDAKYAVRPKTRDAPMRIAKTERAFLL